MSRRPPARPVSRRPLHEFCGPAVIASVLGLPRKRAAEKLLDMGALFPDGSTDPNAITRLTGVKEIDLEPWYPRKRGALRFPTTTQFLAEHPRGEFVLRSHNHVIHVKNGRVVEDNGSGGSRMRVMSAWPIKGTVFPEEVFPESATGRGVLGQIPQPGGSGEHAS